MNDNKNFCFEKKIDSIVKDTDNETRMLERSRLKKDRRLRFYLTADTGFEPAVLTEMSSHLVVLDADFRCSWILVHHSFLDERNTESTAARSSKWKRGDVFWFSQIRSACYFIWY